MELTKKKRWGLKTAGIILAVLLLVVGIAVWFMGQMITSGLTGANEVADFDTRLEIWNTVPGNSGRSKLDDMNIDAENSNLLVSTLRFAKAIVNSEYEDKEQVIDTFTYLYEIKRGFEAETYEDKPYLIPYPVAGSEGAVIVIPGGGFGYKSMDGTTGEGKDIAAELNKAGYSAFVLHYRSNPYEYPYPQLDVQRAVRYLRYHAGEYGFAPSKIGMIGFSAGGNQVGTFINLIMGNDLFPKDYTPDEIDAVDDTVTAPAMIYPALTFDYNVPMLFAMFDDEDVRDSAKRQALLDKMDLKQHINQAAEHQFVSYGTKDAMVGMDEAEAYIAAAQEAGISVTEVPAEGKDHGYGFRYYREQYLAWLKEVFEQ